MKELFIATGNRDKVAELRDILKTPVKIVDIELDEVQSMDLEHVARAKTQAAFDMLGAPVVVDDVGLYIDALNGLPGPFAKYFFEALGNDGLLGLLRNEKNRLLIVRSAVGYHDGHEIRIFVGEVKGSLAHQARGADGWGFDPIIIPQGQDKTYAEMGSSIKNQVSHRRRAFDKLKNFLDSQK